MKIWAYRVKYTFLRTIQTRWRTIISTVFAIIGGIYTISEILNGIFESTYGFDLIRNNAVWILIITIVISILIHNKPIKHSCFLKNDDTKITLMVGDILRQNGAFIIPTNTTFDTTMEDEFISVHSVQGQFQEKYYHNSLLKLNRELNNGLCDFEYVELKDGRKTNTKRYPIGTTCKISNDLQHAYFLAVADINKCGKPERVKIEDITTALVSLWQNLNRIGHREPIVIPIIGTGRAGVSASRDKIIQEIIFSFVVTAKEMRVTDHLIICVHPTDFAQKNLHWDELCEYLQYTCKYQYDDNSVAEGIALANNLNSNSFANHT